MMLGKTWSSLRNLATVLLLLASSAAQARSELETVGLAVYTDTARDIYLAGLLLPADTDLETLAYAPGAKAMEYRISTRRISSRGFSGTLLLQAELGSEERAPDEVVSALAGIKEAIQGSLLQGDQFIILLSENDSTSFYLNNEELLTVDNPLIFNFLFSGWIGQSSSAILRDSLLSGQIDAAMLSRYQSLAPSEERIAAVANWGKQIELAEATEIPGSEAAPQAAVTTTATATAAITAAASVTQVATKPADTSGSEAAALVAEAELPAGTHDTQTQGDLQPEAAIPAAELADGSGNNSQEQVQTKDSQGPGENIETVTAQTKPVQVALLDMPVENSGEIVPLSAAEAIPIPSELDDREYQRQLNRYVGTVIKKVFGEVRYPRRAVDKQKQGNVELLAYMDEDGELLDVTLDSSSGYGPLDKAAIKAVRKAAPFPELSDAAKEEFLADDGMNYVMLIPVKFILQD